MVQHKMVTMKCVKVNWKVHYTNQSNQSSIDHLSQDAMEYSEQTEYDYLTLLNSFYQNSSSHQPITVSSRDVLSAIQSLNLNRAPDIFGIIVEHYRYSGPKVMDLLTDIVNYILEKKCMPKEFKKGSLSPPFKKKNDIKIQATTV